MMQILNTESLRQEIVQIDLALNWKMYKRDYISRHVILTNMLGEQEWVDISTILPYPMEIN